MATYPLYLSYFTCYIYLLYLSEALIYLHIISFSGACMTKSELIDQLVSSNPSLSVSKVEDGVKEILEQIMLALEKGERVEVRGFGSFCLHQRKARAARNPKTGEAVTLKAKCVPYFKAGKELKDRVDAA